jgi:protein-S-isoprenylcysteine O-methyltransferase Ste14
VRHPIYTGILFACLVSMIAGATWVSIAGLACVAVGFWFKARLEEGLLEQELGVGNYQAYRARVPMLMPFGPVGGD